MLAVVVAGVDRSPRRTRAREALCAKRPCLENIRRELFAAPQPHWTAGVFTHERLAFGILAFLDLRTLARSIARVARPLAAAAREYIDHVLSAWPLFFLAAYRLPMLNMAHAPSVSPSLIRIPTNKYEWMESPGFAPCVRLAACQVSSIQTLAPEVLAFCSAFVDRSRNCVPVFQVAALLQRLRRTSQKQTNTRHPRALDLLRRCTGLQSPDELRVRLVELLEETVLGLIQDVACTCRKPGTNTTTTTTSFVPCLASLLFLPYVTGQWLLRRNVRLPAFSRAHRVFAPAWLVVDHDLHARIEQVYPTWLMCSRHVADEEGEDEEEDDVGGGGGGGMGRLVCAAMRPYAAALHLWFTWQERGRASLGHGENDGTSYGVTALVAACRDLPAQRDPRAHARRLRLLVAWFASRFLATHGKKWAGNIEFVHILAHATRYDATTHPHDCSAGKPLCRRFGAWRARAARSWRALLLSPTPASANE